MGIRILKGGMMTTVQDLGRYGYQSQGFSVAEHGCPLSPILPHSPDYPEEDWLF